jgi:hypothetical protein
MSHPFLKGKIIAITNFLKVIFVEESGPAEVDRNHKAITLITIIITIMMQ